MTSSMKHHAAHMWTYAGNFAPRGFLEVVDEIHDLPDTCAYIAGAIGSILATGQRKWPVDEVIMRKIAEMVQGLHDVANIAKQLPTLVEDIHEADLTRLRKPRQGEEMMDLAANGR